MTMTMPLTTIIMNTTNVSSICPEDEVDCMYVPYSPAFKMGIGVSVGFAVFSIIFLSVGCWEMSIKDKAEAAYQKMVAEQKLREKQQKTARQVDQITAMVTNTGPAEEDTQERDTAEGIAKRKPPDAPREIPAKEGASRGREKRDSYDGSDSYEGSMSDLRGFDERKNHAESNAVGDDNEEYGQQLGSGESMFETVSKQRPNKPKNQILAWVPKHDLQTRERDSDDSEMELNGEICDDDENGEFITPEYHEHNRERKYISGPQSKRGRGRGRNIRYVVSKSNAEVQTESPPSSFKYGHKDLNTRARKRQTMTNFEVNRYRSRAEHYTREIFHRDVSTTTATDDEESFYDPQLESDLEYEDLESRHPELVFNRRGPRGRARNGSNEKSHLWFYDRGNSRKMDRAVSSQLSGGPPKHIRGNRIHHQDYENYPRFGPRIEHPEQRGPRFQYNSYEDTSQISSDFTASCDGSDRFPHPEVRYEARGHSSRERSGERLVASVHHQRSPERGIGQRGSKQTYSNGVRRESQMSQIPYNREARDRGSFSSNGASRDTERHRSILDPPTRSFRGHRSPQMMEAPHEITYQDTPSETGESDTSYDRDPKEDLFVHPPKPFETNRKYYNQEAREATFRNRSFPSPTRREPQRVSDREYYSTTDRTESMYNNKQQALSPEIPRHHSLDVPQRVSYNSNIGQERRFSEQQYRSFIGNGEDRPKFGLTHEVTYVKRVKEKFSQIELPRTFDIMDQDEQANSNGFFDRSRYESLPQNNIAFDVRNHHMDQSNPDGFSNRSINPPTSTNNMSVLTSSVQNGRHYQPMGIPSVSQETDSEDRAKELIVPPTAYMASDDRQRRFGALHSKSDVHGNRRVPQSPQYRFHSRELHREREHESNEMMRDTSFQGQDAQKFREMEHESNKMRVDVNAKNFQVQYINPSRENNHEAKMMRVDANKFPEQDRPVNRFKGPSETFQEMQEAPFHISAEHRNVFSRLNGSNGAQTPQQPFLKPYPPHEIDSPMLSKPEQIRNPPMIAEWDSSPRRRRLARNDVTYH